MIEGSLRNVPLADVFQVVVAGRKSGVLEVRRRHAVARIYFEDGRIQYASLKPGVHLGEVLVRMDLLTVREVQEILATQSHENPGRPLGFTAVQRGLLEDDDLTSALGRQVVEVVSELITWRDGEFRLAEADVLRTHVPGGIGVDAMTVLLEVAGSGGEGSARSAPGAVYARAGDPTTVALPDGAWDLLALVDGRRSARGIAAEVDLPEHRAYAVLAELEGLGVVARVPVAIEEPLVLVVSPSTALQRLVRLAALRTGARAETVSDGEAAVGAVAEERPLAVVVDADGDGWAVVRTLRRTEGLAHVPMLVLGAEAAGGVLERWRRPRADVMAKPFEELELQEWLTRRLVRALA